jgi:hypothetical protein
MEQIAGDVAIDVVAAFLGIDGRTRWSAVNEVAHEHERLPGRDDAIGRLADRREIYELLLRTQTGDGDRGPQL